MIWFKKDGDLVKMDEPIREFESDKATLDLPSETTGQLKILVPDGSDLKIGAVIAPINQDVSKSEATATVQIPSTASIPTSEQSIKSQEAPNASPAAAKIIREQNLKPSDLQGSGKGGRITKEDVLATIPAIAPVIPQSAVVPPIVPGTAPSPSTSLSRKEQREKMTRMRRTISKRQVSAKNETAKLTTFNEIDLTNIVDNGFINPK